MKVCSKCNSQVNDDLQFCPNCGSSLDSGVQMNNNATETQQPMQDAQAVVEAPTKNKTNYKLIISILAGVVVLCAIIAVVFGLKLFDSKETNSNNTSNETPEVTPEEKSNIVSLGGFDFTIPDGFEYNVNNDVLVIKGEKAAFSLEVIGVSFENMLKIYASRLGAGAEKMVRSEGGHQYAWIPVITPQDGNVLYYGYGYGDSVSFAGKVMNADRSVPGEEAFSVIVNVLTSSQRSATFSPDEEELATDLNKIIVEGATLNTTE